MTEPTFEDYCDGLALIEATHDRRDDDAKLIISEASLDTMRALASISVSVLLYCEETTGTSVKEVTDKLRSMMLEQSVN